MKDYYAILHVLPTAEIDVIQAAFRALSRKYHPDTCTGDKAAASKRMQDINEAYGVLGDVKKRAEYDAKRKADNQEDDFSSNGNGEDIDSRLEEDWKIACKYCPDAEDDFALLNKLSRSLAFAFKSYLLDTKQFSECQTIRDRFRAEFLKNYFGPDLAIQQLGEKLILAGELAAAKSVNRAAKVLGTSLNRLFLVQTLKRDHPHISSSFLTEIQRLQKAQQLYIVIKKGQSGLFGWSSYAATIEDLMKTLTINFKKSDFWNHYRITYQGEARIVKFHNLGQWILNVIGKLPEFKDL